MLYNQLIQLPEPAQYLLGEGKLDICMPLTQRELAQAADRAASPEIHKKSIQIKSNEHCLCRGPSARLRQALSILPLQRVLYHPPYKFPGLGSFPEPLGGMLVRRTREAEPRKYRNGLSQACQALVVVKLLSALQDQCFITCSCLISCSLAADLLKGCFL